MKILNLVKLLSPIVPILVLTVFPSATDVAAQDRAQQRADTLRGQLAESKVMKENLEARLIKLEEALKPENIEKSLAGIGSTRPEDLREFRRRELELERASIQTQLRLLAESQIKLEARIRLADAEAYHQSAGVDIVRRQSSTKQKRRNR